MKEFDPIKCKEFRAQKVNKLKPAAIISIIGICLVIVGIVISGIQYMVLTEAGKTREKFKEYCTKDDFHDVAMKQKGVQTDLEHIKNDIKELKVNSDEVLKSIRRMERKSNGGSQ